MLFIQRIRYKNILSAGNQFIELELDTYKTTILKGLNGNGKSLVITSLIFGLYGRSNRGITKKQLVNSINKKDCVVEVEFQSNGKSYKIKRGIAPNIFEIWEEGKLQHELSAVKDQQKYLEQNILKMSYKTFMQVVVLGSTNYIPFMELSTLDRRELVEELLDIKIFSSMNNIIKEKIKAASQALNNIFLEKKSTTEKIAMQSDFIKSIQATGLEMIEKKEETIIDIENNNKNLESEIKELLKTVESNQLKLEEVVFTPKKIKQFLSIQGKLQQKINLIGEEIDFFEKHSVCPTCTQEVQNNFKIEKTSNLNQQRVELLDGLTDLVEQIKKEEDCEKEFLRLSNIIKELNYKISNLQNNILLNNRQIKNTQKEIEDINDNLKNQNKEIKALTKLIKDEKALNKAESNCKESLEYLEFSYLLLKDGGIKSKIIENYLPVMNNQINKYLQMMDLYINFTLDNEFKESINTPIHENFSYGSFSEGEKQRINLSLLLAWRDIARMKNSTNCNIMFFDETLDSSLDSSGIEELLKIINYIVKDSNIFIISHRDGYDDKFERVLEVKKINGFTKMLT
jgi:DNA repair exonuclease SbcCD ATPase subunit